MCEEVPVIGEAEARLVYTATLRSVLGSDMIGASRRCTGRYRARDGWKYSAQRHGFAFVVGCTTGQARETLQRVCVLVRLA